MDNILLALEKILEERKSSLEDKSYVASLYTQGTHKILEKNSGLKEKSQDIVKI